MLIQPHHICRLVGHKRTGYDPDGHPDRQRTRRRNRWYMRCDRCGTSDAAEVYCEGVFERFTPWRIRVAWYNATQELRWWLRRDCIVCGKPFRRFGRPCGKHEGCDVIPF